MKAPRQKQSSVGTRAGTGIHTQSEVEYSSSVPYLIKLNQDMHKVEGISFSQLCSWMKLDSSLADIRPDLYFRNVYIHHYMRFGLFINSNNHFVKDLKHFWKSISGKFSFTFDICMTVHHRC